jgi:hypothetical protein
MTDQHPITPPPELVREWLGEFFGCTVSSAPCNSEKFLATQAARWGADTELEASLAELKALNLPDGYADRLRTARRPKPPSLKEQALERCNDYIDPDGIIRRALEALPND